MTEEERQMLIEMKIKSEARDDKIEEMSKQLSGLSKQHAQIFKYLFEVPPGSKEITKADKLDKLLSRTYGFITTMWIIAAIGSTWLAIKAFGQDILTTFKGGGNG